MKQILTLIAVIAAATAALMVHCFPIDMPPRAQTRARLLRCDHCNERDAWEWCSYCGMAWCFECQVAHTVHAEAW